MVTYASGYQDNGWSYAFSVSTRQGGNSYVNGVYYNAFGYLPLSRSSSVSVIVWR